MTPLEKAQASKIIETQLNATLVDVINAQTSEANERLEIATGVVTLALTRHLKALGQEWLILVVEAAIKGAA